MEAAVPATREGGVTTNDQKSIESRLKTHLSTEDEVNQSLENIQDETEREAMRPLAQLVTFNAEAVKEAYDNEETFLLVYPDESFINTFLTRTKSPADTSSL